MAQLVLDGDTSLLPQKGAEPPSPIFGPFLLWPYGWMDQDATWHDGRPQPRRLCVRWEHSPLPQRSGAPSTIFGPCLLQPNGWMDQDATLYDGRPLPAQHCVRYGPSSTPRGAAPSKVSAMSVVAKQLDGSRCHWYEGRPWPRPRSVTWGPTSPSQKGHSPQFSAHVYCGRTVAHLSYC